MVHVLRGCSIDELTRCHFGSSPGHRLSFLLPPSRPNVSESHPLLSPTLELSDLSDLTTSPYAQETSVKLRRLQEGNACPTERRKRCGFFLNGACQSRVSLGLRECFYKIWLVVGNMFFMFPYIGNFIIPTDFHRFQRGWKIYKHWLVVSNMNFIFHFIYGMSSETHWRSPSFFKMLKTC